MVKQRMTALDVRATVEEMRASLVGLRLLNIYNISNKMFLFKFGHGENKRSVILENGIRFHLTELAREKPKIPSQFTLKLRKHIRAWRLDTITQLQHDRTVDLCFGVASTEGCFHIIVELFSKGNVILTDHNYKMMMLLRTHRDDEGLNLAVNAIYPISAPFAAGAAAGVGGVGGGGGSTSPSATASVAAGSVSGSTVAATAVEEPHVMLYAPHVDAAGHLHVKHIAEADLTPSQRTLKQERIRSMKAEWDVGVSRATEWTVLQALVSSIRHFGPDLAQHVLTVAGVPNAQMKAWTVSPDDMFAQLVEALLEAYDLAKVDLTSAGGYLIKKAPAKAAPAAAAAEDEATAAAAAAAAITGDDHSAAAVTVAVAEQYESFTPILLAQYTKTSVESLYRQSFGRVCDEFFLITETEKIDVSNSKRSNVAKNKESKFAADHARRINGLEADIAKNHLKGEQLILNAERVDEAIQLINGALATGISWDALRTLLKRRNAEGHPVAYMIHDLFLERNSISVLLEAQLEEDEEDCDVPPMVVEVSLAKTAHANAADYFGQKKQNASKLERTVAATAKAAAGAARKGARKAAEQKEKKAIVKERQRNWWEKFFWFRTSAGDLVLRGKDVQSTELLLRRVKKLGDLFVQCEVDGSLPCLLRPMAGLWQQGSADGGEAAAAAAASTTQPVAAASLCEAGAWCVAFSGAWESKQSTGAWWIYASQVTGGSAAGMYVFSGERNYLPPQPMSLSCALLFYVTRTIDQVGDSTRTTTTISKEEEGRGEEGTVAEASLVDGVVEAVTPAAAADILRCELPHLPTKAQLLAAAAAAAAATTGSSETTAQGEVGSAAAHLASAMEGMIPADTATALADMPTVEELRADQRRQQQSYAGGGGGKASSSYHSSNAAGKGKKGGYARNARVDRAALQGNSNSVAVSVVASEAAAHARTPSVATTATTATTAAAAAQGKAAMSKHQKKKLKKIQDKYGDQDEEDRALGAQVNGNQLSRVQLLELERLAALRQAEEEAKRKAEAMAGRRAARHGRNASSSSSSSSSCNNEEEDEEVEVVSDFSDEDGEGSAAAAHSVSPPPPLAPSMDDLAGDSEREEAASPTIPSPTHKNSDDDNEEEKEKDEDDAEGVRKEEATQGRGARAARNDHEAAVAQQTAELHRAFPHYTMRPTAGDVVQHVVAVCAPMMTVSEYAYQVPLAMGNAKKGVLAAKLLQVFTERAETGTAGAAGSRKTQRKAAKAHADPSSAIGATAAAAAEAAQINPTLVQALKMTSPTDVVEQLRANVKPVEFRV